MDLNIYFAKNPHVAFPVFKCDIYDITAKGYDFRLNEDVYFDARGKYTPVSYVQLPFLYHELY